MSAIGLFLWAALLVGAGIFIGWTLWGDDQGKFYIPKSLDERSGWIHDGKLYTYHREVGPPDRGAGRSPNRSQPAKASDLPDSCEAAAGGDEPT